MMVHWLSVVALLLTCQFKAVYALSSRVINISLVALSLAILLGAAVSCIIMYYYRGSKQPPLSSLENRTSHDLLVEDNINVDGKMKKRTKKKDKEKEKDKKSKDKKSKTSKTREVEAEPIAVESDIERGPDTESAPLLQTSSHPQAQSTPQQAAPKKGLGLFGRRDKSLEPVNASQASAPPVSGNKQEVDVTSGTVARPPLGKDKDQSSTLVDIKSPVGDKNEDSRRNVPPIDVSADIGSKDGGNSSENSPRDETSSVTSKTSKRSANSNATNRVSLTRHLGSRASSGSEIGSRSSTPQPATPLPAPTSKGSSVLQQKLEKLKQNKQNAVNSASDTSDGETGIRSTMSPSSSSAHEKNESASLGSGTVPSAAPLQSRGSVTRAGSNASVGNGSATSGGSGGSRSTLKLKSPLMNSALRNTFIATLSEGLQVVHHTEKGGQPSKLYYSDNCIVIEKKAIFQRKPVKLELKSIVRVEVGRQTGVLQAAGKSVQESCCFSLITSDGEIDIEMPSKAERDAVVEGFHILLQI